MLVELTFRLKNSWWSAVQECWDLLKILLGLAFGYHPGLQAIATSVASSVDGPVVIFGQSRLFFWGTIWGLLPHPQQWFPGWHSFSLHYLFSFLAVSCSSTDSFCASSSSFQFHTGRPQSIVHRYDPPWYTPCRIRSDDWSSRSARLSGHVSHKEGNQCILRLQSLCLSKYYRVRLFRTRY